MFAMNPQPLCEITVYLKTSPKHGEVYALTKSHELTDAQTELASAFDFIFPIAAAVTSAGVT